MSDVRMTPENPTCTAACFFEFDDGCREDAASDSSLLYTAFSVCAHAVVAFRRVSFLFSHPWQGLHVLQFKYP